MDEEEEGLMHLLASTTFATDLLPAAAVALLICGPIIWLTGTLGHRSRTEPDRYVVDGESIEEVPAEGKWEAHAMFREDE